MSAERFPSPLRALAEALLTGEQRPPRPLAELLAAHPEAGELLMDALLAAPESPAAAVGAEAPPEADDGRRIGHYRVERELGRGGQAVVYIAVDTRLGRRVALKVLQADVFRTQNRQQRFRAEAATTSRLDHPGICPIYEVGEDGEMLFLAMRLVEGRTLAAHLEAARQRSAGGPFHLEYAPSGTSSNSGDPGARHLRPWLPSLRLFESYANALHTAHEAGITHRDVKPGNLMVQPDGSGVVLDFGLAADASRDGEHLTRTGDVFGTPAYMAPEQCRGERVDHRADVWALGASLFEALTGRRAFDAPTPEATIRAILSGRVPDPRRIVRSLPSELGIVVGKAMDPEPARRYADAQAFADDLRRIRELRPILASPPSAMLRARRFAQRNPWLVAMAFVLLVSGLIAAWLVVRTNSKARENRVYQMRQELAALITEYPQMQPVAVHRIEAETWLARANKLLERRTEAEALRELVRASGRPAATGEVEPEGVLLQQELDRLNDVDQSVASGLGVVGTLKYLHEESPKREADRDLLRRRITAFRRLEFDAVEDRLLYRSCVEFLSDLASFGGPEGPFENISRELDKLGTAPVAWQDAIDDIAADPLYDYLRLPPQRELQPLGRNPDTKLYEFAHLRSGPPPRRLADGRYEFAEDTGIVLVLLSGGRTTVGAQKDAPEKDRYEPTLRMVEDYLIEVALDPFFIGKHETTRAQWQQLGGKDRSLNWEGTTLRHPVTEVSWQEAVDVLERSGLTLPTEAQWEYAARAVEHREREIAMSGTGTLTENLYDIAATRARVTSLPGMVALEGNDGFAYTAPVGRFPANGFGLYDMRGNVQEWCLDPEAYPLHHVMKSGTGIWLAEPSDKHMLRGHSFLANLALSPIRARTIAVGRGKDRGFRGVRRLDDR